MSWQDIVKFEGLTPRDIATKFADGLFDNYARKMKLEEIEPDVRLRLIMKQYKRRWIKNLQKDIERLDDVINAMAEGKIPLEKMQEKLQ
tara:strand:+ start:298 stop:564 length:267 start_codon:yes stop_codon:yes gene_type:complete